MLKSIFKFFQNTAGVALSKTSIVWFVCVLSTFIIFSPGYMSPDSMGHYVYSYRLDNLILYHPPFMAYIFWVGRQLASDQSGILILQLILYLGGVWCVISGVTKSAVQQSIVLILITIFPATFPLLGVLWKSVWMTGFMLFSIGFCIRFIRTNRIVYVLGAIAFGLVAMLCRFEAAAPVGVVLFTIAYAFISQKFSFAKNKAAPLFAMARTGSISLAAGFAAIMSMVMVVSTINERITVHSLHPSSVFMYQDIVSISIKVDKVLVPTFLKQENPGLQVADLKKAFNPSTCNGFLRIMNKPPAESPYQLRRPQNEDEARQFQNAWLNAVKEHPGAYLQSRLSVWKALFGFTEYQQLPFYFSVRENRYGLTSEITPLKSLAKSYATFWAHDVRALHSSWIYFVASGLVLLFVAIKSPLAAPYLFLLATAGMAHIATMAAITCAGDFRFSFFLVTTSLLGVSTAFIQRFSPQSILPVNSN